MNGSCQNEEYNLALCVLASGSRGNSIFISNGLTSLLIDAGLSGIEIERRLLSKGISPEDIDVILVSHEHNDHIQGVGVLSRRFDIPVYMNRKTKKAADSKLGAVHNLIEFECGITFKINDLTIHPFCTSHDAEDPAGFTVKQNNTRIGIATDLGIATAVVKERLKECSALILEANHDPEMLKQGTYPWPLKQRIKSRTGHLSNEESKKLLMEVKHQNLKHVILAHLSEKNNTPQKALSEVSQAMNDCCTNFTIAAQDVCSGFLYLK